jgi:hypothetical protein
MIPPITCASLFRSRKCIIAWVRENNRKVCVVNRFDKTRQSAGDSDCRLSCKCRHNRSTPTTNPVPAKLLKVGEYC